MTLRENAKNNTLKKSVEVNKMGIGILSQTQTYRSCSERVEKNFAQGANANGIAGGGYIEESSPEFMRIPEATHSDEEEEFSESGEKKKGEKKNQFQSGQEMFEGLIEKLENKFEPTMAS